MKPFCSCEIRRTALSRVASTFAKILKSTFRRDRCLQDSQAVGCFPFFNRSEIDACIRVGGSRTHPSESSKEWMKRSDPGVQQDKDLHQLQQNGWRSIKVLPWWDCTESSKAFLYTWLHTDRVLVWFMIKWLVLCMFSLTKCPWLHQINSNGHKSVWIRLWWMFLLSASPMKNWRY